MKNYRHIFFDLDHTLWDFDKNSSVTLVELYHSYQFANLNLFSEVDFVNKFHEINKHMWSLYNVGKIDKKEIRENRFRRILIALGCNYLQIPEDIADVYLLECPKKKHVMPFTFEVLNHLKQKYKLHIITNGFNDVQAIKLESSNLTSYFDQVITSESIGCKKPDKRIFEHAIISAGAITEESIMIGDNLDTDILGAREFSMDQVYYNPSKSKHDHQVTFEISCLTELMELL